MPHIIRQARSVEDGMEGVVDVLEIQIHEFFAKWLRWKTDGCSACGRPARQFQIVAAICGDGRLAMP